jgi:excisionase family DNA binding protein
MQDWLTTREAAALLKVHPLTLSQWAFHGKVPAAKVGRAWRFSQHELEVWMRDPVKRHQLVPTEGAVLVSPVRPSATSDHQPTDLPRGRFRPPGKREPDQRKIPARSTSGLTR